MRYIVMIRRTSTGYSADVPDVPGCVAVGITVEQTRQEIAEALEGHLEVMRDGGEAIPPATPNWDLAWMEEWGENFVTGEEVEFGDCYLVEGHVFLRNREARGNNDDTHPRAALGRTLQESRRR